MKPQSRMLAIVLLASTCAAVFCDPEHEKGTVKSSVRPRMLEEASIRRPRPRDIADPRPLENAKNQCPENIRWFKALCKYAPKIDVSRIKKFAKQTVFLGCEPQKEEEESLFQALRWFASVPPATEMATFRRLIQEMRFDLVLGRFPSPSFKALLKSAEDELKNPDFAWMIQKLKIITDDGRVDWGVAENKKHLDLIPIYDDEPDRWLNNICGGERNREEGLWYAPRQDLVGALAAVEILRNTEITPNQLAALLNLFIPPKEIGFNSSMDSIKPTLGLASLIGKHTADKIRQRGFQVRSISAGLGVLSSFGISHGIDGKVDIDPGRSDKNTLVLGLTEPCRAHAIVVSPSELGENKSTTIDRESVRGLTEFRIENLSEESGQIEIRCEKGGSYKVAKVKDGEQWRWEILPIDRSKMKTVPWTRFDEPDFHSDLVLPEAVFAPTSAPVISPNEFDQAKLLEVSSGRFYDFPIERLQPSLALRAIEHRHPNDKGLLISEILSTYPGLSTESQVQTELERVLALKDPQSEVFYRLERMPHLSVQILELLKQRAHEGSREAQSLLAKRGAEPELVITLIAQLEAPKKSNLPGTPSASTKDYEQLENDLAHYAKYGSPAAQEYFATYWKDGEVSDSALLLLLGTEMGGRLAQARFEHFARTGRGPSLEVAKAYKGRLTPLFEKLLDSKATPEETQNSAQNYLFGIGALSEKSTIEQIKGGLNASTFQVAKEFYLGNAELEKFLVDNFIRIKKEERYYAAILLLTSGNTKIPVGQLVSALRSHLVEQINPDPKSLEPLGQASERARSLVCDMLLGLSGSFAIKFRTEALLAWGENGKPCRRRALLTDIPMTDSAITVAREIVPALRNAALKATGSRTEDAERRIKIYLEADQAAKIRQWNEELKPKKEPKVPSAGGIGG